MSVSIINKLKSLNLDDDTFVSLTYSGGADVFIHNETAIETAIDNTDVIDTAANLIATPKLSVIEAHGSETILDTLRSQDLLEDYVRGSDSFSDYITDLIKVNFYDSDIIEYSTEAYDYKRGFTTLTANFRATVKDITDNPPDLSGWEVSVETELGILALA